MQNWEEAEKKADAVMHSEKVELATIDLLNSKPDSEDYEGADFLTEQNPEIIFSQGSNFVSGAVFDGRTALPKSCTTCTTTTICARQHSSSIRHRWTTRL